MQTFLPYAIFSDSFGCLDPKRLGNQVYREGLTLIRGGWPNHPASKMWANHKPALALYCIEGLNELERRGKFYPHHRAEFETYLTLEQLLEKEDIEMPSWLGNEAFHASHRSNLLRKNFEHYSQFGWKEPIDLPYIWPNN